MSMVGYILGLGDRHGENISFDSTNGDTVHVDFNCLFNKGEAFEWPERVPFRLTHNMEAAMGPLKHEGMFRYRKRLKAAEEGVTITPSIVPPLPASEVSPAVAPNDCKLPPSVSPELVLFCRKIYDFRSKKIHVPNK